MVLRAGPGNPSLPSRLSAWRAASTRFRARQTGPDRTALPMPTVWRMPRLRYEKVVHAHCRELFRKDRQKRHPRSHQGSERRYRAAWEKAKKADLAAIAEREIAPTGWLPDILRAPALETDEAMPAHPHFLSAPQGARIIFSRLSYAFPGGDEAKRRKTSIT
jgi:hypothetical protein